MHAAKTMVEDEGELVAAREAASRIGGKSRGGRTRKTTWHLMQVD
jgi:hypothetical protein